VCARFGPEASHAVLQPSLKPRYAGQKPAHADRRRSQGSRGVALRVGAQAQWIIECSCSLITPRTLITRTSRRRARACFKPKDPHSRSPEKRRHLFGPSLSAERIGFQHRARQLARKTHRRLFPSAGRRMGDRPTPLPIRDCRDDGNSYCPPWVAPNRRDAYMSGRQECEPDSYLSGKAADADAIYSAKGEARYA